MLGKDDILELTLKECATCVHLHGQVPDGGMSFRPTPDSRSTLELLRYLAMCAIGSTRAMTEGDWDGYRAERAAVAEMSAEAFPAAMARQKTLLTDYFAALTQDQFDAQTATTPMGEEMPLGLALVRLPLAWMVAYRMQLFLHVKQAGNQDVWTPDCWAGVSMDRPA